MKVNPEMNAQPVMAQAVGQPMMGQPMMGQPMVQQPMVVQQPQTMVQQPQMMNIVVPQGISAGQNFQANVNGQMMNVACPPGASAGSTIQIQAPQRSTLPPPSWAYGAQPGGHVESENYCGLITVLVAIFLVPCVCCCPCDSRQVYVDPTGNRFPNNQGGACS